MWDDQMTKEKELSLIDQQIDRIASNHGLTRNDFLEILDKVTPEVAKIILPLLKRRLCLLKQIFKEGVAPNVLLFSRTKND
jgi:chorismate mutase